MLLGKKGMYRSVRRVDRGLWKHRGTLQAVREGFLAVQALTR